jgi:CheY-like chemotaxis protein
MSDLHLSRISDKAAPKTFFKRNPVNSQPLIMVVEDNADNRLMLRMMLEMWEYQVVEAEDGSEAINKAKQTNPDLILMDVGLPDMDGFDATRRIREFAAFDAMPIVFLSGYPNSQAKDAGGNDYLMKPIDTKKLETLLSSYIGK